MDDAFVNAVADAAEHALETLFHLRLSWQVARSREQAQDSIIVRVPFSGMINGQLALVISGPVASRISTLFLGSEAGSDADLDDAIAELTHIIACNARLRLGRADAKIGLPSVERIGPTVAPGSVAIACECGCGEFRIELVNMHFGSLPAGEPFRGLRSTRSSASQALPPDVSPRYEKVGP